MMDKHQKKLKNQFIKNGKQNQKLKNKKINKIDSPNKIGVRKTDQKQK